MIIDGVEVALDGGWFHHRNDWYFARLTNGGVAIRIQMAGAVDLVHVVSEAEWPSIVAHVAAGFDNEAFAMAAALHAGRPV